MKENHRSRYGRGRYEAEQDRAERWRRGEDRYRREARDGIGEYDDAEDYGRTDQGDLGYGMRYRGEDDDGYRGGYSASTYSTDRMARQRALDAQRRERDEGQSWRRTGEHEWSRGRGFTERHEPESGFSGYGRYSEGGYGGANYRERDRAHRHEGDQSRGFLERAGDEIASWFGDAEAARRREQDHRGRGPKDYTRSDERIREDANDRLTEDWLVDASEVTVTVSGGEITLNGTVGDRHAKRRAEDLVESISGAKHVQNNLRVSASRSTSVGYSGSSAGGFGIGYEMSRTPEQAAAAEGGTLRSTTPGSSRAMPAAASQMTQGEAGGETGMSQAGSGQASAASKPPGSVG